MVHRHTWQTRCNRKSKSYSKLRFRWIPKINRFSTTVSESTRQRKQGGGSEKGSSGKKAKSVTVERKLVFPAGTCGLVLWLLLKIASLPRQRANFPKILIAFIEMRFFAGPRDSNFSFFLFFVQYRRSYGVRTINRVKCVPFVFLLIDNNIRAGSSVYEASLHRRALDALMLRIRFHAAIGVN